MRMDIWLKFFGEFSPEAVETAAKLFGSTLVDGVLVSKNEVGIASVESFAKDEKDFRLKTHASSFITSITDDCEYVTYEARLDNGINFSFEYPIIYENQLGKTEEELLSFLGIVNGKIKPIVEQKPENLDVEIEGLPGGENEF
jgi:hypothetical protein